MNDEESTDPRYYMNALTVNGNASGETSKGRKRVGKTRREDRVGKEKYIREHIHLCLLGGAALVFSMTWSVRRMLLAPAMAVVNP